MAAATRWSTGPHARAVEPGGEQQRLAGVGLPEPHDLEHGERVVPGGVVDDLHHPDVSHLLAEGEGVDGDAGVAEARVDARGVEASCRPRWHAASSRSQRSPGRPPSGTAAARTRCSRRSCPRRGCGTGRRPRRRAGRRSWPCSRRSRRRGRAGRRRPGWRSRRAGRRRRSRRRRGPALSSEWTHRPDELEVGVGGDGRHGVDAHRPGRPLDHAEGHGVLQRGRARRHEREHVLVRTCRPRSSRRRPLQPSTEVGLSDHFRARFGRRPEASTDVGLSTPTSVLGSRSGALTQQDAPSVGETAGHGPSPSLPLRHRAPRAASRARPGPTRPGRSSSSATRRCSSPTTSTRGPARSPRWPPSPR